MVEDWRAELGLAKAHEEGWPETYTGVKAEMETWYVSAR